MYGNVVQHTLPISFHKNRNPSSLREPFLGWGGESATVGVFAKSARLCLEAARGLNLDLPPLVSPAKDWERERSGKRE